MKANWFHWVFASDVENWSFHLLHDGLKLYFTCKEKFSCFLLGIMKIHMVCFYEGFPLASPSPSLPGRSELLMRLWRVLFGEEGSSSTFRILLFLAHLCPSCSCVWHTTSSPSPPSHSWSASWRASSATFLPSQLTPWWALRTEVNTHTPTFLTDDGWICDGFLLRSCCVALTGQTQDTHRLKSCGGYNSGWGLSRTRTAVRQGCKHTLTHTHLLIKVAYTDGVFVL